MTVKNTADTQHPSFWDSYPRIKPYAQLARWDRPIGWWLLFWPCVWGMALAPSFQALDHARQLGTAFMFLAGAVAMRGAGCTINDIIDRKTDKQVKRTQNRPLAAGTVSQAGAVIFLIAQLAVGAFILFQLSFTAIIIGLALLPLIATYPLMKRITWWPQFFLGINFNAGALIAWAALENSLSVVPILLYVSGICWTIAYDTVYAHMDMEDDLLAGVKSTALLFNRHSKEITGLFFLASLVLFGLALMQSDTIALSYITFGAAAVTQLIAYSIWPPENNDFNLHYFRLQHPIGLLLALAALAPVLGAILF